MSNNWDPPQIGGAPEIPVTPVDPSQRWWKRKYRRLPVWGWVTGGFVLLLAVSVAFAPDEEGELAIVDEAATASSAVDTFAEIESTTSEPAVTTPESEAASPATIVVTMPDPATTVAPSAPSIATTTDPPTTSPPTTVAVATQPAATKTTAPPTTASPRTAPAVDIAIRFDAEGNDNQNKNDEWVRFANSGSSAIDMTGWVVEDEGPNHRYSFGALVLQPGESVTVFTGCGDDDSFNRFWCNSGSAIWNNDGDTVSLFDSTGALVAQLSG